jgi:PTH1 family peptidyl-tRNA hydrolase
VRSWQRVRNLKRALKGLRPKPANDRMQIVVGLRNPGADYERTRHNVGYEVVERVVARSGETLGRAPSRIRGLLSQTGAGDNRVLFLVPSTFMNHSGAAVRAAVAYYRATPGDLLVVHDDIDLPFGRLRVQLGGGSGGHNGIRSMENALSTRDFSRLKVGVGRPPGSQDPTSFVLRRFTKSERPQVDAQVEDAADVVELWLQDRARAQELAAHRGRDD